jgi:hypothetical protein
MRTPSISLLMLKTAAIIDDVLQSASVHRLVAACAIAILACTATHSIAQVTPATSEFVITQNPMTYGYLAGGSSVAHGSNGGFMASWSDEGAYGYFAGLVRPYDGSASPVADEFQVNTYTTAGAYSPAISRHGDGYVVAWETTYFPGPIPMGVVAHGRSRPTFLPTKWPRTRMWRPWATGSSWSGKNH